VRRLCIVALVAASSIACGGASRFALRPPVWRENERPLARAPQKDDESDIANAADLLLLRPLTHLFLFETSGEARDVNALDEVPNSSWFENRNVAPSDLVRAQCPDEPKPPFVVKTTKIGGVTPGVVAVDARKQKYVLKLDELVKYDQREISTAADAVVSRLYWAAGFNVPCNDVIYVAPGDVRVDEKSLEVKPWGARIPLTAARLREIMSGATHDVNGMLRMTASRFIDGESVGTWRAEGVRKDDANDRIPHDDRRSLRGEMFLAAWTAHWDSRGQNTYDTFVDHRVRHYFLDFSDAIGGTIARTQYIEPRAGFETVVSAQTILGDIFGFGFVRRPWDEVSTDTLYPNLGLLDVAHFDPFGFAPQTPLVRWFHAQPADLAWMARRIARIGREHVRVAVRAGRFSNIDEENRLVEILMGRREKILRASFSMVSPLADFVITNGKFCATDLARATSIATDTETSYAAEFRFGESLRLASVAPRMERTDHGLCITLPPSFAPRNAPRDSAARYATIDVVRFDGGRKTRLRAHFYDLGAEGYVLVGIERP
jgi:hypothetical protein